MRDMDCSFESTFLEPVSHTILNGLLRAFLSLICDTTNGIQVGGMPFHLDNKTQERMDRFINRLQFPSAFGRPACLLKGGCAFVSSHLYKCFHGFYLSAQQFISAILAGQQAYLVGCLKKPIPLLKSLVLSLSGLAGRQFTRRSCGCGLGYAPFPCFSYNTDPANTQLRKFGLPRISCFSMLSLQRPIWEESC